MKVKNGFVFFVKLLFLWIFFKVILGLIGFFVCIFLVYFVRCLVKVCVFFEIDIYKMFMDYFLIFFF